MKKKEIDNLLEGFRRPEIIIEHVWEGWAALGLKIGGAMNPKIKPLFRGVKIAGTAITVETAPGVIAEGWMEAQELAGPGDVIVIDEKGSEEFNVWGGAVSWNMKRKGVEGVVIDGGARDVEEIEELRFPVFARAICPALINFPTGIEDRFNVSVVCGGVVVRPGDIIVGSDGGVVSVPIENADEVLRLAEALVKVDSKEKEWFLAGKTIKQLILGEWAGDYRKKFEWADKP
jgi:regulator of RNase E activity RraA